MAAAGLAAAGWAGREAEWAGCSVASRYDPHN
jgi:hypothetical protein